MALIWAGTDIGKTDHHCAVLDTLRPRLCLGAVRGPSGHGARWPLARIRAPHRPFSAH